MPKRRNLSTHENAILLSEVENMGSGAKTSK
jgi:hypothetical protein